MNTIELLKKIKAKEIDIKKASTIITKKENNFKDINTTGIKHIFEENHNIIKDILKSIKEYKSKREKHIQKSGEDFSQVEYFGRLLLLKSFQDMKLFKKKGETYSKNELKIKLSLIPKYECMLDVLLKILEKEKFIQINNNQITTTNKVNSTEIEDQTNNLNNFKNNLIKNFADMKSHFNLLEICIKNYEQILSGILTADDVLFPVFSIELVEGIFKGNRMANYFNYLIGDCVNNYIKIDIKNKLETAKTNIRILELGAGTGGTSDFVLESIKKYSKNIEYHFTDVSKLFLKKAQKRYKDKYPFLCFKKLDIENDAKSQNLDQKSFDIVIASNVVHATKNIKKTLKNLQLYLKPNGVFLLNEITNTQDFVNLTFGLLDGWWLFNDKKIRLYNSPLLNIETWQEILKKEGFININLISTSHQEKPDSFSQSLFIAQKSISDKKNISKLNTLLNAVKNEKISVKKAGSAITFF